MNQKRIILKTDENGLDAFYLSEDIEAEPDSTERWLKVIPLSEMLKSGPEDPDRNDLIAVTESLISATQVIVGPIEENPIPQILAKIFLAGFKAGRKS